MNLKAYIANNNLKVGEFAKMMGCSMGHLSGIMNNRTWPSKRLAKDIRNFTRGQVKLMTTEDRKMHEYRIAFENQASCMITEKPKYLLD
jgi:transcriptional regulator with XRE-family HTH domain